MLVTDCQEKNLKDL